MALVAHKYMPQEMPEEELRATFAAREHTLDYLVKSLREQCGSKTLTSYLITGPRGSGKTTIVLMLCLRIREDEELSAAWLPVRFPEELPGITSLRDLLAATLQRMAEDGVPGAAEWHERVAREMDDEQSRELAISGLRQIARQQKRRLVLFVENLDLVFDRGLDEPAQRTLRRLLMDSPFMMIVGTAVKVFEALRVYDEAFFNYFCHVPLDRLDDAQVADVLFRRAEYDGNEEFPQQYKRHKARIKAISRLTGGNPRMVLMLYEAIAHGNLASTVETLRALVDELTPLFKDVLEHQFSNQQSKILDALMRSGGTATPSRIARAARLSLNTVTTQLPRLKDMQAVEVRGGGKGRPAYYTVPDQLFCTWYQMRYLRPGRRRIELFVEVLCVWFEEEERLGRVQHLAQQALASTGKTARDTATAIEYFAASLAATRHHAEAQELAVRTWLQIGDLREAALALAEDRDILGADRSRYEAAAYAGLAQWSSEHDDLDTEIRSLRAAIERSPDDLDLYLKLGEALALSGRHQEAYDHFERVVTSQPTPPRVHQIGDALCSRAVIRLVQGDMNGAIADYTTVIELKGTGPRFAAMALVGRGYILEMLGDTEGAITDYTTVVESHGFPSDVMARALLYRGISIDAQGDTMHAMADYTAVVELEGARTDEVAAAFLRRGAAKRMIGDTEGAVADWTAAVGLKNAEADVVAEAFESRAAMRVMQGDTHGAVADWTAVIELEGAPSYRKAIALSNRGVSKATLGDTSGAIADCGRAADSLRTATLPQPEREIRTLAIAGMLWTACHDEKDTTLDRVSRCACEAMARLEPSQRVEDIEAVLLLVAFPGTKTHWPRIWNSLRKNQPPEVVERLEFFRPVAEVLETGDRSRLDPLPPEQRAFVEEVLEKFQGAAQE